MIVKILLLISCSAMFMGVYYSDFNIVSDADNVVLSWHTTLENNLKETSIERKVVNGVYTSIAVIAAKGDNSSYTYVDENAFKIEDGVYKYQLKFIDNDGTISFSSEQTVTHLTSVTKKTWGSIKALFR
ncbi:MAG: hypothetical protein KKF21_06885 [Bacteroidetes bacterium]|nr:hypothetical protein [Bacteroidota bacterium]MBU1798089.1 hypothetical protein [Bacteroidota bacterium]